MYITHRTRQLCGDGLKEVGGQTVRTGWRRTEGENGDIYIIANNKNKVKEKDVSSSVLLLQARICFPDLPSF